MAILSCLTIRLLSEVQRANYEVDQFNSGERRDNPTEAINKKIPAQQSGCTERAVTNAPQRQRNKRDDNQRVENHGGKNGGLRRREMHDVEYAELGKSDREHSGDDGEIFRDVIGDGKRCEGATSDEELFSDFHDFDELGRVGIEIDHVAGFFRGLRAGVHRHTYVSLSQRRRIIRAVAGHGDEAAFGLLPFDKRHLVFRLCFGEKVIDTRLARDGRGSERIVARDHHGANAHGAKMSEAFTHTAFDDIGERDDSENAAIFSNKERRAARVGDFIYRFLYFGGNGMASFVDVTRDSFTSPFANFATVNVDSGHASLRGKRMEDGVVSGKIAAAKLVAFLGKDDN